MRAKINNNIFVTTYLLFPLSLFFFPFSSFSFREYIRERCTREFELNQPGRINSIRKKLINSVNHNPAAFPLAAFNFLKETGKKGTREWRNLRVELPAQEVPSRAASRAVHEENISFSSRSSSDSPGATQCFERLASPTSSSHFLPSVPRNPSRPFPPNLLAYAFDRARFTESTKLATARRKPGNICTRKSAPLFGILRSTVTFPSIHCRSPCPKITRRIFIESANSG